MDDVTSDQNKQENPSDFEFDADRMSPKTLAAFEEQGWSASFLQYCHDMLDPSIRERLQRIPTRLSEFGFDEFGFSPKAVQWALLPAALLYKKYFRVQTFGAGKIPRGRVLLVANHAGQIPLDGMMISMGVFYKAEPPRVVRSMIEKWVPKLPYANIFMSRVGQVVGTPENCRKLLENEEAILVFPEGIDGITKTFDQRYQLQPFGPGFLRLALETDTPIVPVAVIGSEEQAPSLFNFRSIARLIKLPALPFNPILPIPPFNYLPLPTRYRIFFGAPMHFTGDPNDEDMEIEKHVSIVRSALQSLIERGLAQRKHIFW